MIDLININIRPKNSKYFHHIENNSKFDDFGNLLSFELRETKTCYPNVYEFKRAIVSASKMIKAAEFHNKDPVIIHRQKEHLRLLINQVDLDYKDGLMVKLFSYNDFAELRL